MGYQLNAAECSTAIEACKRVEGMGLASFWETDLESKPHWILYDTYGRMSSLSYNIVLDRIADQYDESGDLSDYESACPILLRDKLIKYRESLEEQL